MTGEGEHWHCYHESNHCYHEAATFSDSTASMMCCVCRKTIEVPLQHTKDYGPSKHAVEATK